MPHVGGGGGSSSGGFHSSSSGKSTPRFDNNGNEHSSYYIRPGYYYHGIYVPYSRHRRMSTVVASPIISMVFTIILFAVINFSIIFSSKPNEENLENFALDKYAEVYNESSKDYEYNILVTIVAYPSNEEFDYVSIVGDYVNNDIDKMFGNQKTRFGGAVFTNVNPSQYYNDLYTNLAKSIDDIIPYLSNCYSSNTYSSKIINESGFGTIYNQADLEAKQLEFYQATGYNLSFYIASSEVVYQINYISLIIVNLVLVLIIGAEIVFLIKCIKAVKEINEAQNQGKDKDFFEGEDDYETHKKNNPDPYDWKSDFE